MITIHPPRDHFSYTDIMAQIIRALTYHICIHLSRLFFNNVQLEPGFVYTGITNCNTRKSDSKLTGPISDIRILAIEVSI